MRGYWADRHFLGERVFDTPIAPSQRRVPHAPPRHMCLLEGLTREDLEVEYRGFSANDFLSVGDFPSYFASRMQARLPEVLKYTQERKTHKTAAHYRAEAAVEAGGAAAPAGPAGVVLGDVPFPPDMEVVLDPDKLSLLLPIPARLIPIYGPANFRSRTRGHFDFGDNPIIRWICPWWRIRISRQYGMIQRVPRVNNFKSGLITSHLLTSLADRWRNRNNVYLDEGTMQDAVTPAYVNWFFTPQ
ncbi:hypothetical protein JCGZ_25421 [Jatropha curcas]|uniref:Aminotransferase-like plant mobile domain-containing protein n=1 Tax=Jatropha curcas TaxID=180498 RepID=A0A067JLP1_JATCU|nr:hypothetical protein JCGZ_25421 [Jatropha curcas]